jgi:hypothetical protein
VRLEGSGQMKKKIHLIGTRTRDLPACGIEPQPTTLPGRAIPQAVSRWLPTAAARVQTRVWSSGICSAQSAVGAGFLRVLRFPLPPFGFPCHQSSFHQILHHHNHPGAGTIGHSVTDVPSGPIWTPPPTMRTKKKQRYRVPL